MLDISNPERQLAYGYSIVKAGGKIVKSVKDVKSGEELDISVKDGIIKTITK
jgi:exonuclease VII large subunit